MMIQFTDAYLRLSASIIKQFALDPLDVFMKIYQGHVTG